MIKFSFLIQRISGMSFEDFVNYHKTKHAPLFTSIPEVKQYVRKYIVTHAIEAEGFSKPAYDAITELWFDSMEDFQKFFTSQNYLKKVHPDESKFIDLTSVVIMITNETIVIPD